MSEQKKNTVELPTVLCGHTNKQEPRYDGICIPCMISKNELMMAFLLTLSEKLGCSKLAACGYSYKVWLKTISDFLSTHEGVVRFSLQNYEALLAGTTEENEQLKKENEQLKKDLDKAYEHADTHYAWYVEELNKYNSLVDAYNEVL